MPLLARVYGQPQNAGDRLRVLNGTTVDHANGSRKRKEALSDELVFFGTGSTAPEVSCHVQSHSLVQKSWADPELKGKLPAAGRVSGFFFQLALRAGERVFPRIDAASG